MKGALSFRIVIRIDRTRDSARDETLTVLFALTERGAGNGVVSVEASAIPFG